MEISQTMKMEMFQFRMYYLDWIRFSYRCFRCEDFLPGHDIWEVKEALEEQPPDGLNDDVLGRMEELDTDLFVEHGDVLVLTCGLCDNCRHWYERQWRMADHAWMRARFSAIPTRIKHDPEHYLGVINFFDDWEEFSNDIKPKLVFCRLAYSGETPSIDRYWPDELSHSGGKPPYASRTTRVIPQRLNSGLASGDVTRDEVQLMCELRTRKPKRATIPEIAAITGRSSSTVWRKLHGQYMLTIGCR